MSRLHGASLIFTLCLAPFLACHASTEITGDRPLRACVDTRASTELGPPARPASDARVFANINGAIHELDLARFDESCAIFEMHLHPDDVVSSVTAIDPKRNATTLLDVSSDELRLRIQDTSERFHGARTAKLAGTVVRTEPNASVSVLGDGVNRNAHAYGITNEQYRLDPGEAFDLTIGTWDGAGLTKYYFIERAEGESFYDLPKVAEYLIDRSVDRNELTLDFSHMDHPEWRDHTHLTLYSEGPFSCNSLKPNVAYAYTAFEDLKWHEVSAATVDCNDNFDLELSGRVYTPIKWLSYRLNGAIDELKIYVDASVFIDIQNGDDYTLPNIMDYSFGASDDGVWSGTIQLAGMSTDAIVGVVISASNDKQNSRWYIYSGSSDTFHLEEQEADELWRLISEFYELDDFKAHLLILDGYDDAHWKYWSDKASSHHSFFWIDLNPDYL